MSEERPKEPDGEAVVWYRGWEAAYDPDMAFWTTEKFRAYKGGADLCAPEVSSSTWEGLLDEIDDAENQE